MNHDYFGSLEFENGFAEIELQLGGRDILVEIEYEEGEPRTADLDGLANACERHEALCELVRSHVRTRYRELGIFDSFSVWIEDDPGLLTQLDPDARTLDDVAGESYAKLLQLGSVLLHVGSQEEPGTIIFDLRFGLAEPIDYLIAAEFSIGLELLTVAMES